MTPCRPLTAETPEQREIRELNDFVARLMKACRDWADGAWNERARRMAAESSAVIWKSIALTLAAIFALYVVSPFIAARWPSW